MNQTTASMDQDRPLSPKGLTGFPVLGGIARNRGVHYIVSWLQRLSGLSLAAYLALHLYTLSGLSSPESFKAAMLVYRQPVFVFLAWTLAFPLAFHAFNGMRLLLFELFGIRDESAPLEVGLGPWHGLCGFADGAHDPRRPDGFRALFLGRGPGPALAAVWAVAVKVVPLSLGWGWKLQRLTAAGLLVLLPAHFLFTH